MACGVHIFQSPLHRWPIGHGNRQNFLGTCRKRITLEHPNIEQESEGIIKTDLDFKII
jgi:hypothetical protein